jgi:endogenous inhibitor of DNA gyrase (YacG/DUF329 family)
MSKPRKKFYLPANDFIAILKGNENVINKYKAQVFKTCPECGKTFIPSRSDQTYCSLQCQRTNFDRENLEQRRIYKREWARRKRQEDRKKPATKPTKTINSIV